MHKTTINILALCVALLAVSVHADDFRNASWGMSLNDIMALHEDQLPADRRLRRIAYDGTLAGYDVLIYYRFDAAGGLVEGGYEIATADLEPATVIEQYEALNALLRRRYPESSELQLTWRNQIFKDKPQEWGRAVRIGHLTYGWQHTVPGTRIEHTLQGDRRTLRHVVSYKAVTEASMDDVLEQL